MAEFVRGELITAEKLNQVNDKNPTWYGHSQGGNGWQDSPPIYTHTGGRIRLKYERFYMAPIGPVEGMKYRIYKFENGTWVTKKSEDIQGAWPSITEDFYISDLGGEGWYKVEIWANDATVGGGPWISAWIYGISTKNIKGDYLRYYDKPDSSGNPISIGNTLTAEDLNTGRVMTTPHL